MTNKNRHGVNQHDENQKEEIKKQFQQEVQYEFILLAAALLITLSFFLIALFNNSAFFSLLLSLYAFIVTFCFETLEWIKYHADKKSVHSKFTAIFLKYYSLGLFLTLIILFGIMVILSFVFKELPLFFQHTYTLLPNLITTCSLLGYFVSYSIRNYFQKKKDFNKRTK